MSVVQFTLCGSQRPWLIALGVMESELLAPYLGGGRILFKGSSTVSCLTSLLADTPLRLCGRITQNGMKAALHNSQGAHLLLYEDGKFTNVDECALQAVRRLGPGDLFVTGANALDAFGHAALLIGSQGGGSYGVCMPYLYTERVRTLVLSSVLKLIPGDLTELAGPISRMGCDLSYGMACSLLPIPGEIITETQALEAFAPVKARVFAQGGFAGAEDSVAIQVEGEREAVEKVLDLVERVKALPDELPVDEESREECAFPCSSCGTHRSCAYANKQKVFHAVSKKEGS